MSTRKCFVIMGFGIKTDFATGRQLDLNKSYNALIKPVVTAKGLKCIRADEIRHSGVIDVVMYKELLEADVVIADLSTANPNAFYELGIRHALRPFTTIVISENKLPYPFDLNHVTIKSYTHLCNVIDYDEVMRFQGVLGETLDEVLRSPSTDSPVYTYLNSLMPPSLQKKAEQVATEISEAVEASKPKKSKRSEESKTIALLTEQGEQAIMLRRYKKAKAFFGSIYEMLEKDVDETKSVHAYIYQRLALCIYKSKEPYKIPLTSSKEANKLLALSEAIELLGHLDLDHTNDPETLSLAGAIQTKFYELGDGESHLANAILYFQRSFYLLYSLYNGINLAYLYVCQANSHLSSTKEEKIADLISAKRLWQMVIKKCDVEWKDVCDREHRQENLVNVSNKEMATAQTKCNLEQKFWILVNKAEAYFGLGEFQLYEKARAEAIAIPHETWMLESFENQLKQIKRHLKSVGHLTNPVWVNQLEVVVKPTLAAVL